MSDSAVTVVTSVVSALTTLLAAFAGAWFAFELANRDRVRDLTNARVAAGNRAIFILMRHFNTLHNLKTQVIDPKRADPLRLLNMRALPQLDDSVHVDLDALTFLLETEHREILGELMVEDERFRSAIQTLNERSKLHRETIQPILREAGVREQTDTTPAAVESMLGHLVYVQLQRATDQAITHVDLTLISTRAMAEQLRAVFLKVYPKRTFIRFAPKDELPEDA